MVKEQNFPGETWEQKDPGELGFSAEKLNEFGSWVSEIGMGKTYQFAVSRNGYLVAEWRLGVAADKPQRQASAAKSFYSCVLGIVATMTRSRSPGASISL